MKRIDQHDLFVYAAFVVTLFILLGIFKLPV